MPLLTSEKMQSAFPKFVPFEISKAGIVQRMVGSTRPRESTTSSLRGHL